MTLYFDKGRYEIEISEPIHTQVSTLMGTLPMTKRELRLYKRYFKIFRKCKSRIDIELDSSFPHIPVPSGRREKEGGAITHVYRDNPKSFHKNLDGYLKKLSYYAFEMKPILPQDFAGSMMKT